jgi:hypothetical protein
MISGKAFAIAVFTLLSMAGTAWAQYTDEPRKFSLTGDVLFGVTEYAQNNQYSGGPAATVAADLAGYWRDMRVLQYEFKPTVTFGDAARGAGLSNGMTGFSGTGIVLQGSNFPLNISFSRASSALSQTSVQSAATDVLAGSETKTTNQLLNVDWLLRFKHFPVVDLKYQDSDYSATLPESLGSEEDRNVRDFVANARYSVDQWLMTGWYQDTLAKITTPDVLLGSPQIEQDKTENLGCTISRPWSNSSLDLDVNQTKSNFSYNGAATETTVRNANASWIFQPLKPVNTWIMAQYISNAQEYQVQQALSGAGVTGVNSTSTSMTPSGLLAAPYSVLTVTEGGSYRLGHGFTVTVGAAEGRFSNAGSSSQWNADMGYVRNWRSGGFSADISHSSLTTSGEVVNGTLTSMGTVSTVLGTQSINADTGSVNVIQRLPNQFKLATSAHVSEGTITEAEIQSPNHDYGGYASLIRPLGGWTLTGNFSLDRNVNNLDLMFNQSSSTSLSLSASFRHLSLSAGRQYGSGLAVQSGNGIIFVTNPVVVSPILGTPLLSDTTGTTVTGSYQSPKRRFVATGSWGRFDYTTNRAPATVYDLVNLYAAYQLRRLRLLGGYITRTQTFAGLSANSYNDKMIYFQIERVFRLY